MANILQMAGNREVCNDHDHVLVGAVDYVNCARADGNDNLRLHSKSNKVNDLDKLNDDASDFIAPLPVCTSTPAVERPPCKLLNSVVAFPKLDDTIDSGLGDTFHSSPSLSDTASPPIRQTYCVSVTEAESKTHFTATSTPSFASLAGGNRQQLNHGPAGGVISSTPIGQPWMGRQLAFSLDRSQNISSSPLTVSSFRSDFNLHRHSEDSISTVDAAEHPACKDNLWPHEEDSDDEDYCSTSKVSMSVESPCATDESSQSADLFQQLDRVFQHFSPPLPGRLIGRKVGVEFVDIVGELDERNVPAAGVIAWLTPYLTPTDFLRYCTTTSFISFGSRNKPPPHPIIFFFIYYFQF